MEQRFYSLLRQRDNHDVPAALPGCRLDFFIVPGARFRTSDGSIYEAVRHFIRTEDIPESETFAVSFECAADGFRLFKARHPYEEVEPQCLAS